MKTLDSKSIRWLEIIEKNTGITPLNIYVDDEGVYILVEELLPFGFVKELSKRFGKNIFVYKKEDNPLKLVKIYFEKVFGKPPTIVIQNNGGRIKILVGNVSEYSRKKFVALKKFLNENYNIDFDTFSEVKKWIRVE